MGGRTITVTETERKLLVSLLVRHAENDDVSGALFAKLRKDAL